MSLVPVFWFTGLSGAGKTTVADGVKLLLGFEGRKVLILDGDEIRQRLHSHFDFTPEGIIKNNAAIAQLCRDQAGEYDAILVAIISPYRHSRSTARKLLGPRFYEIYFAADLATVVARDVKGLYAKAKKNEITNLIGYSDGSVYEAPERPDLVIDSSKEPAEESIKKLYQFVIQRAEKS